MKPSENSEDLWVNSQQTNFCLVSASMIFSSGDYFEIILPELSQASKRRGKFCFRHQMDICLPLLWCFLSPASQLWKTDQPLQFPDYHPPG